MYSQLVYNMFYESETAVNKTAPEGLHKKIARTIRTNQYGAKNKIGC